MLNLIEFKLYMYAILDLFNFNFYYFFYLCVISYLFYNK